jgi:two-component system sensor histidine kinase HydH
MTRWLVVALPGVGALVMLLVLSLGWVQTRNSADLILRGEAALLVERVGRAVRELPTPPTDDALRSVVDAEKRAGLLFVAAVGQDGVVIGRSGPEPSRLEEMAALRPGDFRRDGNRAWARSQRLGAGPPRGDSRPPRDDAGPEQREDGRPPRDEARPPRGDDRPPRDDRRPQRGDRPPPPQGPRQPDVSVLVLFEPHLVSQVDRAGRATLLAGVLGALGLLLLGALANRLLRRNEEAMRRLEQERHLASLGTMSAVVAHELRNPLAALKGHAQLLVESLESQPREKAQAQRVVDAAWRLERLSGSLLDLARTGTLAREEASPASLVKASVAPLDPSRVRVDESWAPARWSLDPIRFQQVVMNLVENGLQTTGDGAVEVRIAEEGGHLVIEVRDHGPGVPAADRERIFEPFVTSRAHGVGLGLAVARQVVVLHGGTLVALDAPGGGALFRIEIPAA